MRRPLLLLSLLGLVAGAVVLVMAHTDPPPGNDDPTAARQGQGPEHADTAPMSTEERTTLEERTRPPRVSSDQLPEPLTMTFWLREQDNHDAISEVDYKLFGPAGLHRETEGAKAPLTVVVQKQGGYRLVLEKPGFFRREVTFAVTGDSRGRHLEVAMKRAHGRVRVEVRDRASNNLVAGFKVRVTYPDADASTGAGTGTGENTGTWVGPIAEAYYDALLQLDVNALIQVEAPGYTPSDAKPVRVTNLQPTAGLTFVMERAMAFTGIELRVFDAALHPARRVRVVAEVRQPDGGYREVWNRQASRENGIYRLPEIKPGIYRLTVRAVSQDGTPDLHVPFVKEIRFTGSENYLLPVQLVGGGNILLKVTDQRGNVLGEGVGVQLLTAAGEAVRTLWEHIDEAGRPLPFVALGANGLVQNGRARLFDPIPPGQYRLKVQRGSSEVRTVPVNLEAGVTRTVRVRL